MVTALDRWEKDPFFSAAEEVQESADRMESTYRTWIHAMNDSSGVWNLAELRRSLQATLGTTKWQLEEFGRAVTSTYHYKNSEKDTKDRHKSFITAIENQVARVENSLNESSVENGNPRSPWTRLDEGERNELAMFLSGSGPCATSKTSGKVHDNDQRTENSEAMGSSVSKWKWPDNGYRKVKVGDLHQDADTENLTRGMNVCYERSTSCFDDHYGKRLYGWYGAIQRLLQRSQYEIQYRGHVQAAFCIVLLCLLA